jgi:hypothetical protein
MAILVGRPPDDHCSCRNRSIREVVLNEPKQSGRLLSSVTVEGLADHLSSIRMSPRRSGVAGRVTTKLGMVMGWSPDRNAPAIARQCQHLSPLLPASVPSTDHGHARTVGRSTWAMQQALPSKLRAVRAPGDLGSVRHLVMPRMLPASLSDSTFNIRKEKPTCRNTTCVRSRVRRLCKKC